MDKNVPNGKPIEAGCRAVVVNTTYNDGKIVNVIKRVEAYKDNMSTSTPHEYRWETDGRLTTTYGMVINHIMENQLQRIDDEEDTFKAGSWEALKDIFVPDRTEETV